MQRSHDYGCWTHCRTYLPLSAVITLLLFTCPGQGLGKEVVEAYVVRGGSQASTDVQAYEALCKTLLVMVAILMQADSLTSREFLVGPHQ